MISLNTVKTLLWAGPRNMVPLALVALENRGCSLRLEDAAVLYKQWANLTKHNAGACFFCEEKGCTCIDEAALPIPGPNDMSEFRTKDPMMKVGEYACRKCSAVAPITLGVVAARYAKGKAWTTPKLCKACWKNANQVTPEWKCAPLLEYVDTVFVTGHAQTETEAQAGE